MQKQQAKEAAQAADTQLSGFNKQPGQAEAVKKRLDEVQNEYEGVINYANSGRLTG